jgi:hypothetical protein
MALTRRMTVKTGCPASTPFPVSQSGGPPVPLEKRGMNPAKSQGRENEPHRARRHGENSLPHLCRLAQRGIGYPGMVAPTKERTIKRADKHSLPDRSREPDDTECLATLAPAVSDRIDWTRQSRHLAASCFGPARRPLIRRRQKRIVGTRDPSSQAVVNNALQHAAQEGDLTKSWNMFRPTPAPGLPCVAFLGTMQPQIRGLPDIKNPAPEREVRMSGLTDKDQAEKLRQKASRVQPSRQGPSTTRSRRAEGRCPSRQSAWPC